VYPDLLEGLGIDLYGLVFERVLWSLGLLLCAWLAFSAFLLFREERKLEASIRLAVALGGLLWFSVKAYGAFFSPQYLLMFEEELVIHTYAFMIVTGFLLGTWLVAREGARVGIPRSVSLDLAFWALIGGMIGARLIFVLVSAQDYVDACVAPEKVGLLEADCFKALKFWEGGVVFYGAFLGAVGVLALIVRQRKLSMALLLDTAVPSLALGHAFGRIGCLSAGCCWGEVCTGDWGVRFSRGSMPYTDAVSRSLAEDPALPPGALEHGHTPTLHATQLYEVFGELAIFFFLLTWRPFKQRHGELVAAWMTLYGLFRIFSESVRGDMIRGYLFERTYEGMNAFLRIPPTHPTILTTSQLIGFLMAIFGAAAWIYLRRSGRQAALRLLEAQK
jgi:phosphatidylglycerol:prolipoprotein diacylglycerol transferase